MAFKKQGFGDRGGFRSGGQRPFSRGGFGGGHGGGDRGERFQAVCADCGTSCEVPFRPNGKKPVYCKDCFPKHQDREQGARPFARQDRGPRDFSRPRFDREAPRQFDRREAPAPRQAADPRIDSLARDMAAMNAKLDTLAAAITDLATVRTSATPALKTPKAKKVAAAKSKKRI